MPKIFISYAKKDTRPLAEALTAALNAIPGLQAWMDASLEADESWAYQIQQEIDAADYMVVLLSPDVNRPSTATQRRSFVLNEIDYAQQDNKPILPVLAQKTKIPVQLAGVQYIDLTAAPDDPKPIVERVCKRFNISLVPTKPTPNASADAVRAIIGDPFAWCVVPAGEFLYGEDKRALNLDYDFAIAKYPITYAQYQVFIDAADGYKDARWWDGLAFEQPKQQTRQTWEVADHPRECVNWYAAIAFCRWLSFKLGSGFDLDQVDQWTVRLPTEFEWEKAARGTDGRAYPYGDEFDKRKCNTIEAGKSKTTPVTAYPQGASPYGALDMSGNVWEWCLSDFNALKINPVYEDLRSASVRVQRGGSCKQHHSYAAAPFRAARYPNIPSSFFGFRLVTIHS